jgi:hypothetical protein
MTRLSLQVVYLWCHVSSTAPPFILWWPNLEILFGPLHCSSPFIGELRCQAIQMEHGPYIAERTQNAVYMVRWLWIERLSFRLKTNESSKYATLLLMAILKFNALCLRVNLAPSIQGNVYPIWNLVGNFSSIVRDIFRQIKLFECLGCTGGRRKQPATPGQCNTRTSSAGDSTFFILGWNIYCRPARPILRKEGIWYSQQIQYN